MGGNELNGVSELLLPAPYFKFSHIAPLMWEMAILVVIIEASRLLGSCKVLSAEIIQVEHNASRLASQPSYHFRGG